MLKHRLTIGPILILVFLGVIWVDEYLKARGYPPGRVFTALLLIVAVEAARELAKIFRARHIKTNLTINAIAICAGILVASQTEADLRGASGVALVCTAGVFVMLLAMLYYSRNQNTDGVVASTAATLLAFVYIGLLAGFLVVLVKEYTGWLMLGIVLITKSYDIGAYFTGRSLGRHKLIPWLSPGKTWEGLGGGVLFAATLGAIATNLTGTQASGLPPLFWWQGAVLGAAFGLIGQAGDLVASLLKRDAGLKDYSRAIPGFGGVMDVADSPLLVAPVAYWLLKAITLSHEGSSGIAPVFLPGS